MHDETNLRQWPVRGAGGGLRIPKGAALSVKNWTKILIFFGTQYLILEYLAVLSGNRLGGSHRPQACEYNRGTPQGSRILRVRPELSSTCVTVVQIHAAGCD